MQSLRRVRLPQVPDRSDHQLRGLQRYGALAQEISPESEGVGCLMALRLSKSIFIHVPKAGGTWVTRVLGTMGMVKARYPLGAHCSIKDVFSQYPEDKGLKSFCFVRHPLGWYQSFWAYRQMSGWDPNNSLDECRASTFSGFVENVLERHPGYLSGRLRELTDSVTHIGRFEALRESLIRVLTLLGETFSSEVIYDSRPENESAGPVGRYTADQIERLHKAELYAFEAFGYNIR